MGEGEFTSATGPVPACRQAGWGYPAFGGTPKPPVAYV